MLYSKIMVPYDGSEHAKHALEYAKGLAVDLRCEDRRSCTWCLRASWASTRLGTEGSLDGVPFGMLNYEQYEGVVRAALDQAKEKVTENLAGLVEDIADIVTIDVVAGTAPAEALARYADKNGCDLIRHGPTRPGRHSRHARKRELRASALDGCSRFDGKIGKIGF